jgi:hypothetical protein
MLLITEKGFGQKKITGAERPLGTHEEVVTSFPHHAPAHSEYTGRHGKIAES